MSSGMTTANSNSANSNSATYARETAQAIHRQLLADRPQLPQREEILEFIKSTQPLIPFRVANSITEKILSMAGSLGPLQSLLEDDHITEIMVNGPGTVLIEKAGQIQNSDVTLDLEAIEHIIERIIAPLGLQIDRRQPFGDARLPDGARVNIIIPPLALDGPYITIRRFVAKSLTLQDFTTPGTAQLLRWLVRSKANIIISGSTGSGKTTLMNSLAAEIPDSERVITIEDAAELQLHSTHVVRMETRPATADGVGAVDARALVKNALRMRPDRIILGEARGGEVLDMLQAMNTGHEGSLSTCHANSASDALRRLEMMALLYNTGLSLEAIREQMLAVIDAVVHMERTQNGQRRIAAVAEIAPTSDGQQLCDLAGRDGLMRLPVAKSLVVSASHPGANQPEASHPNTGHLSGDASAKSTSGNPDSSCLPDSSWLEVTP